MTETAEHRSSSLPVAFDDDSIEAVPVDPDQETSDELEDLDRSAKRALVEGFRQDTRERKKYAKNIYRLTVGWLGLMGAIVIAQGFGIDDFHLDNSVLISLVTTTTAGIVGLLLVVVKYLFRSKDSAAQQGLNLPNNSNQDDPS